MDIRLALVVGELVCGVVGVGAVGSGGEPVSHRVVSVGLVLELRRAGVRVSCPEEAVNPVVAVGGRVAGGRLRTAKNVK